MCFGNQLELANGGTCSIVRSETEVVLTYFRGPFDADVPLASDDACLVPPWPPPPPGPWPSRLAENTTLGPDRIYLGPPDDIDNGISGRLVTYDFAPCSVIDGPGADLSIYERDTGMVEFKYIDVLISADGVEYHSIRKTQSSLVRIPGDEAHGDDKYGRSYDMSGTGLSAVRFVRVVDTTPGWPYRAGGFNLDAIGAIHILKPPASSD